MKDIFKKYLHSKISSEEFEMLSDFVLRKENSNVAFEMMKPEWDLSLQTDVEPGVKKNQVFQLIVQQIFQDEAKNALRKVKIYSIGLRVAAILVIGLIFSSVWFYMQSSKETGFEQIQTVSIPYGAKTKLAMPDGSTVWINSGSTLSFSSNFSKKREVELKGEAFFEVQKNNIPFEVITSFGKVRVMGTGFNVLAYPEIGFITTLVHGSVQINSKSSKQPQMLKPGEQAELVADKLIKSKVETELFTSWKDGKMIFKHEPFSNLMKRLERWFNVKIEYSPEDFKDLWYSGTIENETISEVMNMIGTAAPVHFTFDSKTRVIKVIPRK